MAKATNVPQATYSHSGSKDLLQRVINDPKYVILRWNPAKKCYDEVRPYQVYRDLLKKAIADLKFPNKAELENIQDVSVKVFDELVELLPELVAVHLNENMKFRLPVQPEFNGTLAKKYVPAGSKVSDVRDIRENKVTGKVKSEWKDHYVVKCSSKRPADAVKKTKL